MLEMYEKIGIKPGLVGANNVVVNDVVNVLIVVLVDVTVALIVEVL